MADAVARKRAAREAAPGGAAGHAFIVSTDLAAPLRAHPLFRHKVAAHALVLYALGSKESFLEEITDEQLQQGGLV